MKIKKTALLITTLLVSCNRTSTVIKHNYHETKECLISWDDVFLQKEDDYITYFYSERCGYCNEIKQDVISYYLANIETMYFVCTDIKCVIRPNNDIRGINNINDFYIFGTPFLVRLLEHQVYEYYVGASEIKEYVNNI